MGELVGKSPVAMGATGDQSGDTLLGNILNELLCIFLSFPLSAGEEEGDPAAPINAQRLIADLRLAEKGLQGTAELVKEEEGASEKDTDHNR